MKKHIIGTLCTLALSLVTTLGGNQNSSNLENEIYAYNADSNIEIETSEAEEVVNKVDEELDKQEEKAEDIETTEEISEEKIVPVAPKDKAELPLVQEPVKEETAEVPVKEEAIEAPTPVKEEIKRDESQDKRSDINNILEELKSSNGKTFVYKNIDLSQCETEEDIIDELQGSGSNITSIEEILNLLQNSNGQKTVEKKAPESKTPEYKAPENKAPEAKAPVNKNNGNYANDTLAAYANEVLQLVNQERAKAGLSSLTSEAAITAAANVRAQESRQSFSHTRPNGTSFSTALREHGVSYRTSGENIAYGQRTPQEVVNAWMNSPGHRANILNPSFNKIGIGVYQYNGTIYWSQLFTN